MAPSYMFSTHAHTARDSNPGAGAAHARDSNPP